jgi:hypothetical protein
MNREDEVLFDVNLTQTKHNSNNWGNSYTIKNVDLLCDAWMKVSPALTCNGEQKGSTY